MAELPVVDKVYTCFDDGKIHKGRRYEVTIKFMVPFDKIDEVTLLLWYREVSSCPWLYAIKTDFFVLSERTDNAEKEVFVRDVNGGWFGIGGFLGCDRLDITGELDRDLELKLRCEGIKLP